MRIVLINNSQKLYVIRNYDILKPMADLIEIITQELKLRNSRIEPSKI
jgi:hypothetical protein